MPRLPKEEVYWYSRYAAQAVSAPRLDADLRVPVVIIGGGMAGLMCARRLVALNVECVVLESSFCGAGATGKSSGFITPDSEIELDPMIAHYGAAEAKRLWDFATGGVHLIEQTIERHDIACDYQVQDSLFVASSAAGAQAVEAEHRAQDLLGYANRHYDAADVATIMGTRAYPAAIRTSDTFGICAYAYCLALKQSLMNAGVRIYEESPVRRIDGRSVWTDAHVVTAEKVVVCVDRFLPELEPIGEDVYHAQTFLAISKPLADAAISKMFPEAPMMVWDTDLIYQYYRLTGEGRLLFGAATLRRTYAHHESHRHAHVVAKMHAYLERVFPRVNVELEFIWPGLIGVSKDFLPLAGDIPEKKDCYVIAGAAGLPWAAALGEYIAEKITTGRNDYDEHFSPARSFSIGHGLQDVLGKRLSFAICHGVKKYFVGGTSLAALH